MSAAIFIGFFCACFLLLIAWGIKHRWDTTEDTPDVSIMVCARDEEKHIFNCLMSIAGQSYPQSKMHLILVNHMSTDRTGEIMETFADGMDIRTTVLHVTEPDDELVGKAQALEAGMQVVDTEIVLHTDADVFVPESWVGSMVSRFTEHVVAVGGMVDTVEYGDDPRWITRLQHVDHRFFLGSLAGLTGLAAKLDNNGKNPRAPLAWLRPAFRPAFCSGNNMGFRTSAYKLVGGYRAIAPSLIEDFAMVNRMVHRTKKHLAVHAGRDACIQTIPQNNIYGLLRQKQRWATATWSFNPVHYFSYLVVFSTRVLLFWWMVADPLAGGPAFLMTTLASMTIVRTVGGGMTNPLLLRELLVHEVYQWWLNHWLIVTLTLRKSVRWKGQDYKISELKSS
ncbi:glycosyltransferase [bacterium]|nr:glycosyltransferase [bacterium]